VAKRGRQNIVEMINAEKAARKATLDTLKQAQMDGQRIPEDIAILIVAFFLNVGSDEPTVLTTLCSYIPSFSSTQNAAPIIIGGKPAPLIAEDSSNHRDIDIVQESSSITKNTSSMWQPAERTSKTGLGLTLGGGFIITLFGCTGIGIIVGSVMIALGIMLMMGGAIADNKHQYSLQH